VAVGSPQKFIFVLQEEQPGAEACNRLTKNALICWNYLYLEKKPRTADPETRDEMMKIIKAHAPRFWVHVNMLGEYDFPDKKLADSFGILPLKVTPWVQTANGEQKTSNLPGFQCLD